MITDEEGHEWARSKGMVRLDVHNELLGELKRCREVCIGLTDALRRALNEHR